MKYIVISLLLLFGFTCLAQTDSLLFRSISEIITREKNLTYRDQLFLSVNKDDLTRLKLKDTTLIEVESKAFKIILAHEPTSKKDLYAFPIEGYGSNYEIFRIATCNNSISETFFLTYTKDNDAFYLDPYEVEEEVRMGDDVHISRHR